MTSKRTSKPSRTETELVIEARPQAEVMAELRRHARRIDSGQYTPQPAHLSFESMELLLSVLTSNRWRLLKTLQRTGPSSIRSLARELGRDYRGVHADVMALMRHELVVRNEQGNILVPWRRITAEIKADAAA